MNGEYEPNETLHFAARDDTVYPEELNQHNILMKEESEPEQDIKIIACLPPARDMNLYRHIPPPVVQSPSTSTPSRFDESPTCAQSASLSYSSEYINAYLSGSQSTIAAPYFPNPPQNDLRMQQDIESNGSYLRRDTYNNESSVVSENLPTNNFVTQENCPEASENNASKPITLPRHQDLEFHRALQSFVKNKRIHIQRHLEDKEKPELPTRETERIDYETDNIVYGVTPTLDYFSNLDPPAQRKEFFENVRFGDLIIAEVVELNIEGLELNLLSYDGGKRGNLEELRITGFCPTSEMIPANPNDLNQIYKEKNKVRCEVLEINSIEKILSLGMQGKRASVQVLLAFPLGLIFANHDMPHQYLLSKRALTENPMKGKSYEDFLLRCKGFQNPDSVGYLGRSLGIFNNQHSLMTGLGLDYRKKEMSDEMRKTQNLKWAETYEKLGRQQFGLGNEKEAFTCLDKAIYYDNKNIKYLVIRGALHVVAGNFIKAMEDLEEALRAKPEQINAKQSIADTFVTVGKGLQKNGLVEEAIKSYTNCLSVLPDSDEMVNILKDIQSQVDALEPNCTSEVVVGKFEDLQKILQDKFADLQKKLQDMLSEEISRASKVHHEMKTKIYKEDLTLSVGKVAKHETKTEADSFDSSLSSSSSTSSESDSDYEAFLAWKKSKRDIEKIDAQVDAFMAKCDSSKYTSHSSIPPEKKPVEKVELPSKIEIRMDQYGNYIPPKTARSDTLNYISSHGVTNEKKCIPDPEPRIRIAPPLVPSVIPHHYVSNNKQENEESTDESRSESYSSGRKSLSSSRTSSRCSLSLKISHQRRKHGFESHSKHRSQSTSSSPESQRKRRSSSRSTVSVYGVEKNKHFKSNHSRCSRSSSPKWESKSRPSSKSTYAEYQARRSTHPKNHRSFHHRDFQGSSREWEKRRYPSKLPKMLRQTSAKVDTTRTSPRIKSRQHLPPTSFDYVSPRYLGRAPIRGFHFLPPVAVKAAKLAHKHNAVSFKLKSKAKSNKIREASKVFKRTCDTSTSE